MENLSNTKIKITQLEKELLQLINFEIDYTEQEIFSKSLFALNPLQMNKQNNKKYRGALSSLEKKGVLSVYGETEKSNDYLAIYYILDI